MQRTEARAFHKSQPAKAHQIIIWASAWDIQQCGMYDQQRLRPACAYAQCDQSLCWSLEYSMNCTSFGFQSLKGGCTGSSESTLVKMPHCWKSHVTAQIHEGDGTTSFPALLYKDQMAQCWNSCFLRAVIQIGGSLAQTPNIELSTYEDSISNFCIRMILANIYSVLFTNHVNSSLRSASHLNTDRNWSSYRTVCQNMQLGFQISSIYRMSIHMTIWKQSLLMSH